ncbi:MAG TPA: molybdopterin-dependent oxidoreductase [Dehalococcoidia bacterium]|nr:molybdopterin-dependent oxidoreductase [Dehalococcoidia bacterium]
MTTKPIDTSEAARNGGAGRTAPATEHRYRKNVEWDSVTWATHCVDCYPGNCPYRVYVKDGVIVGEEQAGTMPVVEEGVPDMNPLGCQKGAAWSGLLNAPERVLHPLKRAGARGAGKWAEVSWNQALTEIADHILDAIEEDGPETIINEGTPGEGGLMTGFMFSRLIGLLGGLALDTNATINDFSPGIYLTFGKFDPASSIDDIFHTEFVMYTHSNPAYTMIPSFHFTTEARYKGAEVVVVAPDCSPSHTHADYYVPIKPGTDAALGLAMAQVIIEEGTYNREFVCEQTDLPLLVRVDNWRFLRGSDMRDGARDDQFYIWDEVTDALAEAPLATLALGGLRPALSGSRSVQLKDGTTTHVVSVFELMKERLAGYTPEKASEMCGVNPEMIRTLARKIASKRGSIFCGGTSFKYYHSDLMLRSYLLVLALTGNWGRKGTGPVEWSVAGFDGPFLSFAKSDVGRGEARKVLELRKALTGAIKNEDPTMTEEMAHIELMHRFAQVQGQVPPAMLWYEHWGYKENWNNRDYNDPSMQRPFDDFIKEALAKDWWKAPARTATTKTPRVYFEVGGNAMRRTRGGQNLMLPNIWAKLRCAVSVDWRMNTTGMWADYVLPVAHHFEKMAFMFPTPHLMNLTFSDKAVEPPPGVMAEVEMAVMLAEKIEERAKARGITEVTDALGAVRPIAGLRNLFTMNGALDNTESVAREWVSDAVESGNLPEGTSLDTLREKGYMRFLNWGMGPMSHSQAADIKMDETHTAFTWHTEKKVPYPTLTRRAQFYIDHEWFMEADEALPCHKDNPPQGGDYPFSMTSGHNRWSVHSMNITNKTLLQTHRGRPHLVMNDSDAARLGIRDEEEVDVHNDLGTFIVPVKLSPSVRPGQVISYNGWEPYQYKTWKGASDLEPGMVKWLHFAGDYGHLRYWPLQWQPVPFDRGIRVEVSKID